MTKKVSFINFERLAALVFLLVLVLILALFAKSADKTTGNIIIDQSLNQGIADPLVITTLAFVSESNDMYNLLSNFEWDSQNYLSNWSQLYREFSYEVTKSDLNLGYPNLYDEIVDLSFFAETINNELVNKGYLLIPYSEILLTDGERYYKNYFYFLVEIIESKPVKKKLSSGITVISTEYFVKKINQPLILAEESPLTLSNPRGILHFTCVYDQLSLEIIEACRYYENNPSNRFIRPITKYAYTQWIEKIRKEKDLQILAQQISHDLMEGNKLYELSMLDDRLKKIANSRTDQTDSQILSLYYAKGALEQLLNSNSAIYQMGLIYENAESYSLMSEVSWMALMLMDYPMNLKDTKEINNAATRGLLKAEKLTEAVIRHQNKNDPLGRAIAEVEGYEYYEYDRYRYNEPTIEEPQFNITLPILPNVL